MEVVVAAVVPAEHCPALLPFADAPFCGTAPVVRARREATCCFDPCAAAVREEGGDVSGRPDLAVEGVMV